VIQCIPPYSTSYLETEGVAVAGQGCLRVVVREEALVDGDIHGGQPGCGSATRASRFLIDLDKRVTTPDPSGAAERRTYAV
jgi:hypothetical protein